VDDKISRSEEVYSKLREIVQAMDIHSKYLHKYYGLSGPQLTILNELSNIDKMPTGQLAQKVSLSQATVTDIIDRLEEKELVTRQRSSFDKRKVYIQISDKGRAIMQKNPSLLKEEFIRQFNELEDWEQTLILSSMQRIVSMMKPSKIIKNDQKNIKNSQQIIKKE